MIAEGSHRPRLAAGLAAFALGDREGRLSWTRECRGAAMDWGGVYAQGVRLTGPWRVGYAVPGGSALSELPLVRAEERPGSFQSVRSDSAWTIAETVAPAPDQPRVLVERRARRRDGSGAELQVTSSFAPFLAPVLLEGIRPGLFDVDTRGGSLRIESAGFFAEIESDPPPVGISLDGRPVGRPRVRGPVGNVELAHPLRIPPGGEAVVRIVLSGGRSAALAARAPYGEAPGWAERSARAVSDWEARAPSLRVPAAPELEAAFTLARRALRSLYTAPEPGFTGLIAGYPWYAALWCRDLARMLPAVLWMGDFDWTARSLDTVFRFQAPHDFPLLAARAGELPMQVSPGPIFLYGTSDTSLYYPDLVRRFLGHSADGARVGPWLGRLDAVRRWGEAKLDPRTGLFRNGGEIEGMRQASLAAGRVHVGIDAPDTTIWDSADRRDHANDLQSLWLGTLRALAALSDLPGAPVGWRSLGPQADAFAKGLPERYRWAPESYLYDSLASDGRPVTRLRPNALAWVGLGILSSEEERAIVSRASREDLAVDWGVRTLSSTDPEYDPESYHMGQVWPIATAWLARAAFAIGDAELGAAWLGRAAHRLVVEEGFSNECYRGDRAEPFDSCFLLGFSVAPFLQTVFEGLWGLSVDAAAGVLAVDPHRPPDWPEMSLQGLRVGAGRLDLRAAPGRLEAHWSGPGPLVLAGPDRSTRLDAGESGGLELARR